MLFTRIPSLKFQSKVAKDISKAFPDAVLTDFKEGE